MKKTLLFIALIVSVITEAQVSTVSLQASGLTCSMCSNAIYKSLKTLDFVLSVDADIKTYTFGITFKEGSTIDFGKIKTKVESAGFTVCAFVATIHFDNVRVSDNQPVVIQNQALLFQPSGEHLLNGQTKVRFMDKGFVSAKEFKTTNLLVSAPQTYHVSL
ncbi:MAG: heavy-metal-associated domain-containing protein [Chitinophagaceae bacterium]